jgi:hypothetical protein
MRLCRRGTEGKTHGWARRGAATAPAASAASTRLSPEGDVVGSRVRTTAGGGRHEGGERRYSLTARAQASLRTRITSVLLALAAFRPMRYAIKPQIYLGGASHIGLPLSTTCTPTSLRAVLPTTLMPPCGTSRRLIKPVPVLSSICLPSGVSMVAPWIT